MSEKYTKIIEEIEKLTAIELSELVKALEEKFGVSAAPTYAAGAAGAPTSTLPVGVSEKKNPPLTWLLQKAANRK